MAKMLESLEVYKTLMLAVMSVGVLILLYKVLHVSKKNAVTPKPPVRVIPISHNRKTEGLDSPFDRYKSELVKDKTHISVNRWNAL